MSLLPITQAHEPAWHAEPANREELVESILGAYGATIASLRAVAEHLVRTSPEVMTDKLSIKPALTHYLGSEAAIDRLLPKGKDGDRTKHLRASWIIVMREMGVRPAPEPRKPAPEEDGSKPKMESEVIGLRARIAELEAANAALVESLKKASDRIASTELERNEYLEQRDHARQALTAIQERMAQAPRHQAQPQEPVYGPVYLPPTPEGALKRNRQATH